MLRSWPSSTDCQRARKPVQVVVRCSPGRRPRLRGCSTSWTPRGASRGLRGRFSRRVSSWNSARHPGSDPAQRSAMLPRPWGVPSRLFGSECVPDWQLSAVRRGSTGTPGAGPEPQRLEVAPEPCAHHGDEPPDAHEERHGGQEQRVRRRRRVVQGGGANAGTRPRVRGQMAEDDEQQRTEQHREQAWPEGSHGSPRAPGPVVEDDPGDQQSHDDPDRHDPLSWREETGHWSIRQRAGGPGPLPPWMRAGVTLVPRRPCFSHFAFPATRCCWSSIPPPKSLGPLGPGRSYSRRSGSGSGIHVRSYPKIISSEVVQTCAASYLSSESGRRPRSVISITRHRTPGRYAARAASSVECALCTSHHAQARASHHWTLK